MIAYVSIRTRAHESIIRNVSVCRSYETHLQQRYWLMLCFTDMLDIILFLLVKTWNITPAVSLSFSSLAIPLLLLILVSSHFFISCLLLCCFVYSRFLPMNTTVLLRSSTTVMLYWAILLFSLFIHGFTPLCHINLQYGCKKHFTFLFFNFYPFDTILLRISQENNSNILTLFIPCLFNSALTVIYLNSLLYLGLHYMAAG